MKPKKPKEIKADIEVTGYTVVTAPIEAEMALLVRCNECGAVVGDQVAHQVWHKNLSQAITRASVGGYFYGG